MSMRFTCKVDLRSYNTNQARMRRNWITKLLSFALGSALVIGLSPMSNHMISRRAIRVEAVTGSQSHIVQGNAGGNSSGACCDAIGTCSLVCDFMVFQSAGFARYGGSEQVVNSDPIVHSIYIVSVTPPPKI